MLADDERVVQRVGRDGVLINGEAANESRSADRTGSL
jgi:hypothetical protein